MSFSDSWNYLWFRNFGNEYEYVTKIVGFTDNNEKVYDANKKARQQKKGYATKLE